MPYFQAMKQILCALFILCSSLPSKLTAQKKRPPVQPLSAGTGKSKSATRPLAVSGKTTKSGNAKGSALSNKADKHLSTVSNKKAPTSTKTVAPFVKKKTVTNNIAVSMLGQLQWPLTVCDITEPFGYTDMGSYTLYNPGITLSSPAPVMAKACHQAVVENIVQVEDQYVVITSYNGLYFGYSNLSEVMVSKGHQLQKGDAIGTIGIDDSGRYSLLFLVQIGDKAVDPKPWFSGAVATIR